jgi:hypothetical protein
MAAYRPSASVNDLLRQFQALQTGAPGAYTPSASLGAAPGAYAPSEGVSGLLSAYQQAQANRPGAYTSQWSNQLSDLYNQIANRPAFSYDLNADMLYQQYRDQYTRGGRQAMRDTMGQASAMTGGFGNSYAQTAGQQAYQSYMQRLNDVVPQLEDRAYGRYRDQGTDLYNLYGLTAGNEDRDYGRYRDQVGDWRSDRDFAYGQYQDERGFDYGQYRDTVGDWQDNRNFDYGQYRDSVADWRDDRNFSYDLYTNERSWDAQQQAAAEAASRGGRGGGGGGGGGGTVRTGDNLRAADAYMSGGVTALDNFLRRLEQEGVPAAELMALRMQIMSSYAPIPLQYAQTSNPSIPGGR